MDEKHIATIEAIVCVVESGRTDKYDAIATMAGDTGGLSFGRHQASLGSGNLYKLIKKYSDAPGAAWADELQPYLKKLEEKSVALNTDQEIKKLLRAAAGDPVMVDVQDEFFFDEFMKPALKQWEAYGFQTVLSAAVIYDSFIHGNFKLIAKRVGIEPTKDNEQSWTKDYLEKRRIWLSTHTNKLLHATAIRIEALQALAAAGNWSLKLPFDLKRPNSHYPLTAYDLPERCFKEEGKLIIQRCTDPTEFGVVQVRKKSGAAPGNQRDIFIQRALIAAGFLEGRADGDFGAGTEKAIRQFQKACSLKETGSIGPGEYLKLCEAVEAGKLVKGAARADAGLKPSADNKDRSGVTGAATYAGGAVAGTGAIIAGSVATDEADKERTADAPAEQQASATVENSTAPESTDGQPPAPVTQPQPQTPAAQPEAPATRSETAAPPTKDVRIDVPVKSKLCARTNALFEIPFTGCKVATIDVLTVGAGVFFIAAVVLFAFGRRIFEKSNRKTV